jgi:polar amino acid transport system substrate-binding protein
MPPGLHHRRAFSATVSGLACLTLACLSLACSACGGSSSQPATVKVSGLAGQVPASVRSRGVLRVATNATYAPNEFITNGHIAGMDADLATAIARQLGLRVQFYNVGFDQLITGVTAGRYDVAMSSMTDTKARQQAVDMVTYFNAGNSFVVLRSSPLSVSSFTGLCGHTAAIEAGSTYVQQVAAEQPHCISAGKPHIHAQTYASQADANLALLSGRAQITIEDSPVAAYQARQDHRFKVTGRIFGTAPYGIAVAKTSGLAVPIRDALRALIATGAYHSITSKWGIATGDITSPVINGATS